MWSKARIRDNAARRRLIESVIYGLLDLKSQSGNVKAAELALNALGTVGNPLPPRIKTALGERVKGAVTGTKALEDKALVVLPALGYTTTTKIFGRSKRVNYDD